MTLEVILVPLPIAELRWGQELSFVYEGRRISDGVFIAFEDEGQTMRLMFSGSTFGRFELTKVSEMALVD